MKVLITGGAGFIGHHLAIYLNNLGYDVVCVDNLLRSSKEAINALRGMGIKLIVTDVVDYRSLGKVFNDLRPDAIVHTAALVSVTESFIIPDDYIRCNVIGTLNTIRLSCELGIDRFIYISSAAVYGDPIKLPITEDHPLNPISPYGLSKLVGEEVVRLYSRIYGVKYIVLRLFNVYGPRQPLDEYSGVIRKFIDRISRGLPPIIYGDGTQSRDFIHVTDVCRAIELSLSTKAFNDVYNVGSGRPISINELAELIISISGLKIKPLYEAPRAGDIRHSYADISKISSRLGFKPSITIEEGIKELITAYKA